MLLTNWQLSTTRVVTAAISTPPVLPLSWTLFVTLLFLTKAVTPLLRKIAPPSPLPPLLSNLDSHQ